MFTPAYGSVTNVRINSCMRTPQVLRVLLNKFKIENSPDDFAIYLVHASGGEFKLFLLSLVCREMEYLLCVIFLLLIDTFVDVSERVKLKRSDYPLALRIMQGPCEQVCKVFLMEEDLGEEVTYDVNHYIYCRFFFKGVSDTELLLLIISEHNNTIILTSLSPVILLRSTH